MRDANRTALVPRSPAAFADAVDSRWDAAQSVVQRYRNAYRFAADDADDARFKDLLERTSIREGLRTFPLLCYRGTRVDVLDASSRMHTRTHKSIDGCVTTAQCLLRGYERIVFESGGNTGVALTAYGARAGIETFCFVPEENLTLLDGAAFADPRAHVIAVADPGAVKTAAATFAERHGIARVPELAWRHQASTFIGCFLLERWLAGDRYDHLVQSISAAFAPIGIYRALESFGEDIGPLPSFLGVQQAANCPMVRAWRGTAPDDPPPPVRSTSTLLAKVMYDGEPRTYGTLDDLRRILLKTHGDLTTLDPEAFARWLTIDVDGKTPLEHLAANGVHVSERGGEVIEKTGLMGLAGALREIAGGGIQPGSRVLVCVTGGTARPEGRVSAETWSDRGA